MKKTIFSLLLLDMGLMAEVTNMEVSVKFIEENSTKIIDIRTEDEWKNIGVIPKAHLITFFGKDKKFSGELFLQELNRVVEKDEPFAIISNSSSRSKLVSNFLGKKHDYKVINLLGGISELLKEGYDIAEYNACKIKKSVSTQESKIEEPKKAELKQVELKKADEIKAKESNATKS